MHTWLSRDVEFCSLMHRMCSSAVLLHQMSRPCTTCWAIYHRYECAILPLLHQIGGVGHLAFRLLFSTGLNTIRKVVAAAEEQSEPDACFELQDPTDVVSLYAQLYNLVIVSNPPHEELCKHKLTANVLIRLAKHVAFEQYCAQEDEQFARDILLRHIL